MKKLLITCFAFMILTSCTSLKELSTIFENKNFFAIDFSKYSESGFLITPEKYLGEYTSIGIVRYEVYPGAYYKIIGSKPNPNFGSNPSEPKTILVKEWVVNKISMQEALDGMYKKCLEMGANALVNFDVKYDVVPYTGISNPVYINGYVISGFAIKRKQ
ncbi:MAG: hypothetical protein C0397_18650 [Odoribacter sp.]|nr:hypothetical protein [Odoribacter sp.]